MRINAAAVRTGLACQLTTGLAGHGGRRPTAVPVSLSPPVLDFGDSHVCMTATEKVTITNAGAQPLVINSATSDTVQFRVSGAPRSLEAGESGTLSVSGAASLDCCVMPMPTRPQPSVLRSCTCPTPLVAQLAPFPWIRRRACCSTRHARLTSLARTRAPIRGALIVLCGMQVFGRGVPNEFGVQPVTDARVAVGVSLTHPIVLRNPWESRGVNILEVFTTEPFLHLQPPDPSSWLGPDAAQRGALADAEGDEEEDDVAAPVNTDGTLSAALWRVPPLTSREVVQVSVQIHKPGLYQVHSAARVAVHAA